MNRSVAGVQREWWVHRDGCGLWFRIDRDTGSNVQVAEEVTAAGKEAAE
jgi:sarcosine oxidase subunit delta